MSEATQIVRPMPTEGTDVLSSPGSKPTWEQIQNEPAGPRMDGWMAEHVMGWHLHPGGVAQHGGKVWTCWKDDRGMCRFFPEVAISPHSWAPSRNPASAWEVLDLLTKEEQNMNYQDTFSEVYPGSPGWRVRLRLRDGRGWRDAKGETFPLALCRAALLAALEL